MGRPKKIVSTQPIKEELSDNKISEVVDNIESVVIVPVKAKRGRKPNKIPIITENIENSNNSENNNNNNIICEIKEIVNDSLNDNLNDNVNNSLTETKNEKTPLKKRGRKPKGGKIIQQIIPCLNVKETKPNIILHLKCCLKDLKNNLFVNNLNGFNFDNKSDLTYDIISNNNCNTINNNTTNNNNDLNLFNCHKENNINNFISEDLNNDIIYNEINNNNNNNNKENLNDEKDNNIKEVWKKLKTLEHNLHINNISDKKSACFWCTYDFDSPCIYIPKHFLKDSYHVYGCFCSPECATAYLMDENIDTSSKFERYHLLNHIYSKIYDYKKNIKPAPNPFYILDKYYGNLNINEYRGLLKSERLFLVVDKPLTRILPELHEDNDDFIINNKVIPSNNYQIKKKLGNKNLTKTSIMNEKFGLHP